MANPLTYQDMTAREPQIRRGANPQPSRAINPLAATPAPASPQSASSGPGVLDYINRGDPVKDIARGLGEKMLGVGRALSATADQARAPNTWDDSGTKLQYPSQPLVSSASAPVPTPQKPAAPSVAPESASYSNEPNAPANPLASAATQQPQRQAVERLPSPEGNTEIGAISTANPNVTQTSGVEDSMRQLANIRAMYPERSNDVVTMKWDDGERQRNADFNNFVTRSNMERSLREAQVTNNPRAVASIGEALTRFNAGADRPAELEAERANRLRVAQQQGENMLSAEGMRGQNALAAEALRGRNQTAIADMQGQNQRGIVEAQGQNALAVARASKEMNPLDQRLKELALSDAQTRANLRQRLMSASPEDQRIIAQQIAALDGRLQDRGDSEALKARAGLVGDLAKAYNGPMGAPMGADKQPIPFEQFAAPAIQAAFGGGQQSQAQQAPAFSDYAAQVRARNPGQRITDEQIQAAYAQRYGK